MNGGEKGQASDPDQVGLGPPEEPSRSLISRWLSKADRYASRPLTAVLVIGAAVIWIAISVAAGFPSQWEIVFQSVVAAVTLAIVFVIQHTQARYQRATPAQAGRDPAHHVGDGQLPAGLGARPR